MINSDFLNGYTNKKDPSSACWKSLRRRALAKLVFSIR